MPINFSASGAPACTTSSANTARNERRHVFRHRDPSLRLLRHRSRTPTPSTANPAAADSRPV